MVLKTIILPLNYFPNTGRSQTWTNDYGEWTHWVTNYSILPKFLFLNKSKIQNNLIT